MSIHRRAIEAAVQRYKKDGYSDSEARRHANADARYWERVVKSIMNPMSKLIKKRCTIMFLVYYQGMIIAPDYQRHWSSREDAESWLSEHGFDVERCDICPVVLPEYMGQP